jgi:hypothetical protein
MIWKTTSGNILVVEAKDSLSTGHFNAKTNLSAQSDPLDEQMRHI